MPMYAYPAAIRPAGTHLKEGIEYDKQDSPLKQLVKKNPVLCATSYRLMLADVGTAYQRSRAGDRVGLRLAVGMYCNLSSRVEV